MQTTAAATPFSRMIGLRLIWNPETGHADIGFYQGALDTRFLLETLIIVSLFTDRRANPADRLPPGQTDPRGWWGDSYSDVQGDRIGSRLWLLEGATTYPQLPVVARGYCLEALQWMIEDGVAARVDAQCWFSRYNKRQLDAAIQIYAPGNVLLGNFPFAAIWQEEALRN